MHSRIQLILERLLAYSIVISPPLAGAVTSVLLVRHRRRFRQVWRERWTVAVFALLLVLGLISTMLAQSQPAAIQGPAGVLVLFVAWLVGYLTVDHPMRYWRDLQRGIGIVALITLAWTVRPFTLQFRVGALTIPIAVPHDPVAVFGLGANGLGPLLAFGVVLSLGRLYQDREARARIEAFAVTAGGLAASLAVGMRSAILGVLAGAVTLMLTTGLTGGLLVVLVLLTTAVTIGLRPETWSSLTDPTSMGHRVKLWTSALQMIGGHPWFGVGPFHFVLANVSYMALHPELPSGLGPHNIYFRMLTEWGIPAAVVLFGWLFSWPARLWERRSEIWRWSFVAALVAFLVLGIFDDPLFTMHVSAPVFAGIGVAAADLTRSPAA